MKRLILSFLLLTQFSCSKLPDDTALNLAIMSLINRSLQSNVVQVAASNETISENGKTASLSLTLSAEPRSDVVIDTISTNLGDRVSLSSSSVTFTTSDWSVSRTIEITAVDDSLVSGNEQVSISFSAIRSDDSFFNGKSVSDVSLTVEDNDTTGLVVTDGSSLVVSEKGLQDTFTIKLSSQPTADVTFSLSVDDSTEGQVSPTSMTFTSSNWSTAQTVTLSGVQDNVIDGDTTFHVVMSGFSSTDSSYSSLNSSSLSVTCLDNETVAISTINATGLTTTEAGGTATFQVSLSAAPSASVVVGPILSNDSTEGVVTGEPLYLTFTTSDWSTPQSVTITGVLDSDSADQSYTISMGYAASTDSLWNGLAGGTVSITNTNVTAGVSVSPTSGITTTEDSSCQWISVQLNLAPTADVTLGPIQSNDSTEGVVTGEPLTLTFTSANWNTAQWVVICGVADLDAADQAYTVDMGTTASTDTNWVGLSGGTISLTNTDTWPPASTLGSVTVDGGYGVFNVTTEDYVTFVATAGTTYKINWDDSVDGTATYTSDLYATGYSPTRKTLFNTIDSGYTTGQYFTASESGTYYIKLTPGTTGTIGVSVSTATAPSTVLTDFESGLGSWTVSGLWHISTVRAGSGGTQSVRYADDGTGADPAATFNTGATTTGDLISPTFTAATTLSFDYFLDGECSYGTICTYDKLNVYISNDGGGSWTQVDDLVDNALAGALETRVLDISAYNTQTIQVKFEFNSVDSAANDYEGAYVDNVKY